MVNYLKAVYTGNVYNKSMQTATYVGDGNRVYQVKYDLEWERTGKEYGEEQVYKILVWLRKYIKTGLQVESLRRMGVNGSNGGNVGIYQKIN